MGKYPVVQDIYNSGCIYRQYKPNPATSISDWTLGPIHIALYFALEFALQNEDKVGLQYSCCNFVVFYTHFTLVGMNDAQAWMGSAVIMPGLH